MAEKETREKLVEAALRLFAKQGFDGSSVKEVADEAGVNISLVSYYFGGKEGLYRSCLEKFGRERLAVAERVLQPPSSLEELRVRLGLFAEEIWVRNAEEPEVCRLLLREREMGMKLAQDIFRETFFRAFETLVAFLRAAQERKIIRSELDPTITAGFLFGSIVATAQGDPIGEQFLGLTLRDKTYRARITEQWVSCFLHGLAKSS